MTITTISLPLFNFDGMLSLASFLQDPIMLRETFVQAEPYKGLRRPHPMRVYHFLVLLAMALLSLSAPGAHAAPHAPPTLTGHLTDLSGLLGDREATLRNKLVAFDRDTRNQVYVLAVPTTGGQPIEDYAAQVFQQARIGQRKADNAVLFVIATNEHTMRIEVGDGLEDVLTGTRRGRILGNIVAPLLRQGLVAEAIEAGANAIIATIDTPRASYQGSDGAQVGDVPSTRKRKLEAGVPEALVAGVVFLAFWGVSLLFGVPGLAFVVGLPMFVARSRFPGTFSGAFGWVMLAYVVLPWLYLRWRVIATSVRNHRLPRSRCRWCTWSWAFLFMPFAMRWHIDGTRSAGDFSDFSSSDSDSD